MQIPVIQDKLEQHSDHVDGIVINLIDIMLFIGRFDGLERSYQSGADIIECRATTGICRDGFIMLQQGQCIQYLIGFINRQRSTLASCSIRTPANIQQLL